MNIKRPSILFLGAVIIGIIIAYSGVPMLVKLLTLAIAIILFLKIFLDGKISFKLFILVLVFFLIGFYRFKLEEKIFDVYENNVISLGKGSHFITGIVDSIGKSTNSQYFVIKKCVSEDKELGTCRCYFDDGIAPDIKIGNFIRVEAGVKTIDGPSNEGEFNQKNYYRSNAISFISFGKSFEITNERYDKLRQGIYNIKLSIKEQISKIFSAKDAGLFSAMVTGDKSTIDRAQKKLFSDNGIAHILAISGLHLSILGLALFELLRKKFTINVSAGFVSLFILLYGIFIDAGATSLRAISMLYIRFLSLCIGRTYDSKNTLYIICFIFLMLHPYLLFNAGFQFSYVAIFALNEDIYIKRKHSDPIKIPAVFTLNLFLFPITIYHYFTYPLYSILLNLIVIPLMSFVLGFGLIGLALSFVFLPLGKALVYIVHIIFLIYDKLCYFIEKFPAHLLWLGKPNLYEIIYYYIALFVIIYALNHKDNETNEKTPSKFSFAICCILLIVSVAIIAIRPHPDFRMTFIATGQGDAILIDANDTIFTIDGGSSSNTSAGQYVLTPHIKSRAISHIDYAFITHPDSDHTNAILYLMEEEEEVALKKLVLPINAMTDSHFDRLRDAAIYKGAEIMYVKEGDIVTPRDGLVLTVLNPDEKNVKENSSKKKKDQYDANDMSLTFRLDYKDTSVLFTGDIGKKPIMEMLEDGYAKDFMDVDILKVPHHGSKNSFNAEFFKEISPDYAVISYQKGNSYGHPHQVIVDALEKLGATVLKTGEIGQIDIYNNGKELIYKSYR